MRAWRQGNVAVVSAPGAGIADDKAVYAFVPEIIRYFLGEDPILPNVPTWRCGDPDDCQFVLGHLDALVVKPANESGGLRRRDRADGGAQRHLPSWPSASSSSRPTGWPNRCCRSRPCRRCATGAWRHGTSTSGLSPCSDPTEAYVTSGGLTRVARTAGSLIVNSSQGGGTKDTWIVDATLADLDEPRPSRERSPSPLPGRGAR